MLVTSAPRILRDKDIPSFFEHPQLDEFQRKTVDTICELHSGAFFAPAGRLLIIRGCSGASRRQRRDLREASLRHRRRRRRRFACSSKYIPGRFCTCSRSFRTATGRRTRRSARSRDRWCVMCDCCWRERRWYRCLFLCYTMFQHSLQSLHPGLIRSSSPLHSQNRSIIIFCCDLFCSGTYVSQFCHQGAISWRAFLQCEFIAYEILSTLSSLARQANRHTHDTDHGTSSRNSSSGDIENGQRDG